MPITKFNINNFKRFENFSLDMEKPVIVILGENSSGKSSIIKGLLGLKQTVSPSNEYECWVAHGEYVDLGIFRDYVNNKNIKKNFGFKLCLSKKELNKMISVRRVVGVREEMSISISYDHDPVTSQARFRQIDILFNGEDEMNLCISRQKTTKNYFAEFSENLYAALKKFFGAYPHDATWESRRITISHAEKFTFKPASLNSETRDYFLSRFVNDCLSLLTRYFEKEIFYLGPLRSSPSRSYIRSSHNLAVGVRGEHTPSVLANLERRLVKVTRGKSNFSTSWINFRHGVETVFPGYSVSSETHDELVKLKIASDGSQEYVSSSKSDVISDVGFGFSQVLPIILQSSVMPSGATLLIEQPELHLHPLGQTRLAQFIAAAASTGRRFVIETHSEHFVRGLQLAVSKSRVGNGKFGSENVAFHYITKGKECSKELRINEFGEFIDEWPAGFFDESYNAIRQIMANKLRAE